MKKVKQYFLAFFHIPFFVFGGVYRKNKLIVVAYFAMVAFMVISDLLVFNFLLALFNSFTYLWVLPAVLYTLYLRDRKEIQKNREKSENIVYLEDRRKD